MVPLPLLQVFLQMTFQTRTILLANINPAQALLIDRLRPAGSDPRVGDGLVWNPIPMAFEYTFLDRMQRS